MIDKEIYRRIFDQQANALVRQMYYKCGNPELARDLMQDAFLKLWEKRGSVTEETSPGFLYTVANRLFLDAKKHEKVQLKFRRRHQISAPKDPSFLLEEKQFRTQLEQAISNLPVKSREVFLLNRMEKMSYREIAELLNISQKAVEKRMSIALRMMRKLHDRI